MATRTHRQFRRMNALVARWPHLYRTWLRPRLRAAGRPCRLLDVGYGGGDIADQLAQWAARDGLQLEVTGIDRDPRALAFVQAQLPASPVRFLVGDAGDLLAAGERFDFVITNHVLHHIPTVEVPAFLDLLRRLATHLVLVNDSARVAYAYWALKWLMPPLFPRSYMVPDGLLSIRRSFTPAELRPLLAPGWQVQPQFPARLIVTWEG